MIKGKEKQKSTLKRCLFCKGPFQAKSDEDQACDNLDCQIRWKYLELAMQGKNPREHFKKIIKEGREIKCVKCGRNFKPSSVEQIFTKLCKECKKRERESIYEDVLQNPRKFLDEA